MAGFKPNRARITIPEYRPKGKMAVNLEEILRSTRRELDVLRSRRTSLEQIAGSAATAPSFKAALQQDSVAVIAEVKRRSPSAGAIREALDPGALAEVFQAHGASAVSVLTERRYFGGSLDDLAAVIQRVSIPVLRKDFILDEVQLLETRAAGAAAVLLIVRALGARVRPLLNFARDLELDALVEVHTAKELAIAVDAEATIIGVNSRDLDSFTIDAGAALDLVSQVPRHCVAVAESGLIGKEDVERAAKAGADAVLIGTVLSAAAAPGPILDQLIGVPRHAR
jgi:indole-3-glycerol phosphate synthase